jgi:hypothetical protein
VSRSTETTACDASVKREIVSERKEKKRRESLGVHTISFARRNLFLTNHLPPRHRLPQLIAARSWISWRYRRVRGCHTNITVLTAGSAKSCG